MALTFFMLATILNPRSFCISLGLYLFIPLSDPSPILSEVLKHFPWAPRYDNQPLAYCLYL